MLSANKPLKVKYDDGAYLISYANEYAAGIDIRTPKKEYVLPKSQIVIDTGVHVEIPDDWCGLLVSKSGLNINHGITTTGLIDSDYRGTIKVSIYNNSDETYYFNAGDKITQMVLLPSCKFSIEEVDTLSETERGDKGFGSTGK